jgi:hypothetical protein
MDARVAAGFPPSRARRLRLPAFAGRRPQLVALGAAASVLIAVAVVGSLAGRNTQSRPEVAVTSAPAAGDSVARKAKPAAGGGSNAAATELEAPLSTAIAPVPASPPADTGTVRGGRARRVERSAALTLSATEEKLSDVGDQVIAVTDRYRGIVMRSTVTSAAGQQAGGSFDLRIPVGSLRPALRDLSALADVQSRTENADDVTASFVTAKTRLEELKAERTGLLRRLAKAQTDFQASALRARIRFVNGEIDAQRSSLHNLRRRTSFATVSVALVAKDDSGAGGGGLSEGARDLRDSLIDSANLALRVLGIAIPIALLLALFVAAGAWSSRRRREAALD